MKKKNVYDGFEDWKDVQVQFNMTEPEPKTVLFAAYDIDGYEGTATVLYKKGRKYYWVEGSHCSCYGLEDQWNPQEYTKKEFLEIILRNDAWKYRSYGKELVEIMGKKFK